MNCHEFLCSLGQQLKSWLSLLKRFNCVRTEWVMFRRTTLIHTFSSAFQIVFHEQPQIYHFFVKQFVAVTRLLKRFTNWVILENLIRGQFPICAHPNLCKSFFRPTGEIWQFSICASSDRMIVCFISFHCLHFIMQKLPISKDSIPSHLAWNFISFICHHSQFVQKFFLHFAVKMSFPNLCRFPPKNVPFTNRSTRIVSTTWLLLMKGLRCWGHDWQLCHLWRYEKTWQLKRTL